jgi:uncharacterized protein YndB with AHSA1/START domain
MPAETDRIEKDVLIAAPLERVWELVTRPEHVGRWFGDAGADIDLRPGGRLEVRWEDDRINGRVEVVEPPHRFAYRWLVRSDSSEEPTAANSTLVDFRLAAEGDGTRVAVTESGFDALEIAPDERAARLASHTSGWAIELGHLVADAGRTLAER